MAEQHRPDDLAQLRAEFDAFRAQVARERGRKRLPRRALPFLLAALLVTLIPLATLAANPFTDLVPGSVHNPNIDAIYNAGITTGCVPNEQYCPTDLVTRQEMASFLARTAGLGGNPAVTNAKTAVTANTVGGYAPGALTRLAYAEELEDTTVGASGTRDILTVTLDVPHQSFVHVTFAGSVIAVGAGGCPCILQGQLGMDGDGFTIVTTTNLATDAADVVNGYDRRAFAGARVYLVAPGSHTFTVRLLRQAGTNPSLGTSNLTLQATLQPFGANGAAAAGLDVPSGGAAGSDR